MSVIVRFAPGSTGLLHLDGVRIALVNWLFAAKEGGTFLLRLDDTDRERATPEFAIAIERDLMWLGLEWGAFARHSERLDAYVAAFETLRAMGRVYACYETPEELEALRQSRLAEGRPTAYDRAGLGLTETQRAGFEKQGRKPHWRFRLEAGDIGWDDLVGGARQMAADGLDDPVVVREDGNVRYMLSSAVDDIDLEVTHVIRSEEFVPTTAVQIQVFRALGARPPAFGHVPLLTDATGTLLSERPEPLTVEMLRDEGIEAMALNGLLAGLGRGGSIEPRVTLDELAAGFDIGALGRAEPRFDASALHALNTGLLAVLPFEAVEKRLARLGLDSADRRFWETVRTGLARFSEVVDWHEVCFGDIAPIIEDLEFVLTAGGLLPPEPWDAETWRRWTDKVGAATGLSGRSLALSLRRAVTGRDQGPGMAALLPLIGRARAAERLGCGSG